MSLGAVLRSPANLHLSGNHIASIAGLDPASVPSEQHLGLARNPLTDTSPARRLPAAEGDDQRDRIERRGSELESRGSRVSERIEARSDSITDLTPLLGVPLIVTLDLSDNLIRGRVSAERRRIQPLRAGLSSGNPGESLVRQRLDALCARNVVVDGYCLPAVCRPLCRGERGLRLSASSRRSGPSGRRSPGRLARQGPIESTVVHATACG